MANTVIASVTWVEKSLTLARSRTHAVAVDRPVEAGGFDSGFLGGELFLAGLGGCLASNVIAAVQSRQLKLSSLALAVDSTQATSPQRFVEITVDVDMHAMDATGGAVSESELDKLIAIAERGCLVSNTLRNAVKLVVRRRQPAPI